MNREDFAKFQLEQTYERISFDMETSTKVRNWCVTVWIGSLAIVSAEKIQLSGQQKLLLPYLPILFFWLLDSFHHTFIAIRRSQARELERALLDPKALATANLQRLSLEHAVKSVPLGQKAMQLVRNALLKESIFIFYLGLLAATLVFSWR